MSVFDFFRGLYKITVARGDAKGVISLAVKENIPFGAVRSDGDDCFFSVRSRDSKRIAAVAERLGVKIKLEQTGLVAIAKRHRGRVGVAVGGLLALLIVVFASRFVWDIEITGNERVPDEKIEAALGGYGLKLGAYKPSLDVKSVCERVIIEEGGISWISVDLRGTVARVEVRETSDAETEKLSPPSNLVAACDGQIVSIEAYGGKSEVRAGQTVKKGDVLVSGAIDSTALGYRLVRARGKVLASVSKRFSVSVPLAATEKTATGNVKTEKKIKIFSKTAELFKKTNISYEKYDTIEKTERLSLFGVRLPIFVTTVTYAEYVETPIALTEDEALARAREALSKEIEAGTLGDRILAAYENVSFDGSAYTVSALVECVTDIAKEQIIKTEK